MPEPERQALLVIADQLAEPELSQEVRLVLAAQIRQVLIGMGLVQMEKMGENDFGRKQQARPPPSSSLGE